MTVLPEVRPNPCKECPWRRKSLPGWLGPMDAAEWTELAMSDEPIACHITIKEDGDWDGTLQCAGAARFRANICKSPRDPEVARGPVDRATIFGRPDEFLNHHQR